MGAGCSSGGDGASYSATDPASRLSPSELHAIALHKLKATLFSGLMSLDQLDEFATFFQLRQFPPDTLIVKRGSPVDAFLLVAEGSIRMEVGDESAMPSRTSNLSNSGKGNSPGSSSNLLCVKKAGEHVGESLFAETKGKAGVHDLSVVSGSEGDLQLLLLTRASYAKYAKKHPEMPEILRSVSMSLETQLQQLEFFRGIEASKMKMLVTMFTQVPLLAGAVLFRENDFDRESGNSLYFLYKGRVRVTNTEKPRDGGDGDGEEKVLAELEPGVFFGEVAMMMDIPRTATIHAIESCLLLELSQKNFRHLITLVPAVLATFNSMLLDYNIHLRYFIQNPLVLNYFMQHCKSEFSTENIDFWMAVRDFRRIDPSAVSEEEIRQQAENIQKTYIGNQAERQVNLKGSVEAKVLKGLKEVPLRTDVFLPAEEEILALMSADSFGRFKNSGLFKTCLETVNSPWTAILRKLYLL